LKRSSAGNKTVLLVLCVFMLAGCGLKADPVPPASSGVQNGAHQTLAVSAEKDAAVLHWRLASSGRIRYMIVERSTLGTRGNVCRDCPRTFEPIDRMAADDAGKSGREYRFSDLSVEKGKTYSYRLQLCDEGDVCRESQTVEIDFQ